MTVMREAATERRALGWLAAMSDDEARAMLQRMDAETLRLLDRSWAGWGHEGQQAPKGDWRVWLMMAGRGFGKTRAGAEWINRIARRAGKVRIALVGATLDDARAVMVEGPSGILATASPKQPPVWQPSLGQIKWRGGAIATLYSADSPEGLRGPEHGFAWCDELGKWGARGDAAWDNLLLGLRHGDAPRIVVTTTPRTTRLMTRVLGDPATRVTRGRTRDNPHLPESFVADMTARYGGTRLGAQELDGELIEDVAGALWTRAMIEQCRVVHLPPPASLRSATSPEGGGIGGGSSTPPPSGEVARSAGGGMDFTRVVVAVDPPASATGDACGIVACGIDADGVGHVLEDASVEQAMPEVWARAVAQCAARWGADRVIAESNNGGEMVRSTLHALDRNLPVKLVHASKAKGARAEPVSFLYAQGRVRHCGAFPDLEDQLCGMTAGGYEGPGRSPDRADALVWALGELMLGNKGGGPRVRVMG